MGLLSSPPPQDTTTTKDTDADDRAVRGLAAGAALLIAAALPGAAVIIVAGILAHELRRVRARWFALWAVTMCAITLLVAGRPAVWVGWMGAHIGHFLPLPTGSTNPIIATAAGFATRSEPAALWFSTLATTPFAFLAIAIYVRWRAFSREVRGRLEGPSYTNQRPVGILDRARIRRERRRVAAGHYLPSYPSDAETAPPRTNSNVADNAAVISPHTTKRPQ